MTTPNTTDPIPADLLEFEAATRNALKAMRSGDPQRMSAAFVRYMDISIKMAEKPHDQIVADARLIEQRGRIDLDDWKRIDAALRAFCDEPGPEARLKGFPTATGGLASLQ
ncbi:hypothetical protein QFZ27_001869 [Inquilinus ginsengisoli]|uniref:hypothetical protein n=1 Tax=Inquilinus ginsengisoli TaxID=363840 RepID=UPI003D2148E5